MLETRLLMQIVAAYARREFGTVDGDVPYVTQYVPVVGIQALVVRLREIHLVVLEQIVAGYKVVRIRKSRRARFAKAQMTLRAGRGDRFCIVSAFL